MVKWFGKTRSRISTERDYDMQRLLTLILAISPLCAADLAITPHTPQAAYNPAYTGPMPVGVDQADQAVTDGLYIFTPAGHADEPSAPTQQDDAVVEAERPEMEQQEVEPVFFGPQNRPEDEPALELEQIIEEPGFIEGLVGGAQLIGGSIGAVALLQLIVAKQSRELILKHIPISMTITSIASMIAFGAARNATATTSLVGNIKNCFKNGYSNGWMASSATLGLLGFCLLKC